MCIKKLFSFVVLVFTFIFTLVSCSGEDKEKPRYVDVKLDGPTGLCLPELGKKISDYFSDRLNDENLHSMWNCLDGALVDFEEITTPEHPQGYPPEALARFFSKFFLKRNIPDALAQAIMNLKRVIVGGNREFLTNAELLKLREFLRRCRTWSVTLKPHIRNLLGSDPDRLSDIEFQTSFGVASETLQDLGLWLANQNQAYSQKDFREFLVSMKTWLDDEGLLKQRSRLLEQAIETLPLFFRIKSDFVGGTSDSIKPSEWVCFMKKTTTIISTLQRLKWKMNKNRIFTLATDKSLQSQMLDIRDFFQDVDIPFSEVDDILKMASTLSWWPKSTSAESISQSLYFVLHRILAIDKSSSEMRIDALVVEQLNRVIEIFTTNWNFDNPSPEFLSLLEKVGPVDVNDQGLLIYSGEEQVGEKARCQLATIFSLIQILQQAYGFEHIQIENLNLIFEEFLQELKRFDVLKDVDPSISGRIYREINLFTFASDGDSKVDTSEITQYAWMILSGMNQTQLMNQAYGQECNEDADCIYTKYTQDYQKWLSNYPKLFQFLKKESDETRHSFFEMSKVVAGSSNPILNMVVLGYVEFFVMRYDQDKTGFISFQESELAYQTFGPTFTELAASVGLNEADSWALFTYLFRYGVNPISEFGGLLRFVNWKLKWSEWSYEVNRVRLLQILAELKKL